MKKSRTNIPNNHFSKTKIINLIQNPSLVTMIITPLKFHLISLICKITSKLIFITNMKTNNQTKVEYYRIYKFHYMDKSWKPIIYLTKMSLEDNLCLYWARKTWWTIALIILNFIEVYHLVWQAQHSFKMRRTNSSCRLII